MHGTLFQTIHFAACKSCDSCAFSLYPWSQFTTSCPTLGLPTCVAPVVTPMIPLIRICIRIRITYMIHITYSKKSGNALSHKCIGAFPKCVSAEMHFGWIAPPKNFKSEFLIPANWGEVCSKLLLKGFGVLASTNPESRGVEGWESKTRSPVSWWTSLQPDRQTYR